MVSKRHVRFGPTLGQFLPLLMCLILGIQELKTFLSWKIACRVTENHPIYFHFQVSATTFPLILSCP